jgi:hypothetical protein
VSLARAHNYKATISAPVRRTTINGVSAAGGTVRVSNSVLSFQESIYCLASSHTAVVVCCLVEQTLATKYNATFDQILHTVRLAESSGN